MQNVKVQNMRSSNSNKEVANQFIIRTSDGEYFQSYASVVAFVPFAEKREEAFYRMNSGKSLNDLGRTTYPEAYLDEDKWEYSTTTGKYRNAFLGENKQTTSWKISRGDYQLVNLNA